MDKSLATLFYVGIILPTLITITVFLGFLVCLYKYKLRKQKCKSSYTAPGRALIKMPSFADSRSGKNFDKFSQHSADSAIDVGDVETSLEEKLSNGLVLDAKRLDKSHHSYQNEGMQSTTAAEIHLGTLRKGYYPSHEKLTEEIHSQVKIYEKMSDIQRVALQIQRSESTKVTGAENSNQREDLIAASQKQFAKPLLVEKVAPRYTSTSKLIPAFSTTTAQTSTNNNNQLSKSSNYAYVPSWYEKEKDANNRTDLYGRGHYASGAGVLTWKPNIAASCSSTTDNYSSIESSQV